MTHISSKKLLRAVIGCLLVQLCVGILYLWSVFKQSAIGFFGWSDGSVNLVASFMLFAFCLGSLTGGILQPMNRYVEEETQTIYEGFLYLTNAPKQTVRLQPGETAAYRWLTPKEFVAFFDSADCIERFRIRLNEYVRTIR